MFSPPFSPPASRVMGGAFIAGMLLFFSACAPFNGPAPAPPEIRYWTAPAALPAVRPQMKTSGFWVEKTTHPDRIILDEQGLGQLNRDIRDRLGLVKEIARLPAPPDRQILKTELTHWISRFRDRGPFFLKTGQRAGPGFYKKMERQMNLAGLPSPVALRFGLITTNTDQRLLPTVAPLFAQAGDMDFDRLQNNALDTGTPVAVLHQSLNGQWVYVWGPFSNGWIPVANIAFCPRTILAGLKTAPYVTVIRSKASLYNTPNLTRYHGFVRMGTRLYPAEAPASQGAFAVLLPARQADGTLKFETGYISTRDMVRGHLDYTPRHIIEQAFEMLNTPYGWGGARGEQDCSQFIQEVFACVGVRLPRNSAAQARTGREGILFSEDAAEDLRRATLLEKGLPGLSLLYMKGHVMLYLGKVDGRPYAIHDIWGYRESRTRGGEIRVIQRVAVTDLSLGRGSAKGSLLQRLHSLRLILPLQ